MSDSITLGGYCITFLNAVCNTDNTQTWTYKLNKIGNPKPEISQWLLKLCSNSPHIVTVVTGPAAAVFEPGQPDFPEKPTRIIWNNLNNSNIDGIYSFTLKGCFQKAEVEILVKAGQNHKGTITGPSYNLLVDNTPNSSDKSKEINIATETIPTYTRGVSIF